MSAFIIKLDHEDREYYLRWSTVAQAPTCRGMPDGDFGQWYFKFLKQIDYGETSDRDLREVVDTKIYRARKTGCSDPHVSVENLLGNNCAGEGGRRLNNEEIIRKFCMDGKPPHHY
jgi:hypothetical protein